MILPETIWMPCMIFIYHLPNRGMNLHLATVLDLKRRSLLDKLSRTKKYWRYLAWGTALALQYNHRKSVDFDFFKEGSVDINGLKKILDKEFGKYDIIYEVPNTLYITVNKVKISFIAVEQLKLIKEPYETPYFFLAHEYDIGVMKLATIIQRAEFKDYVDLYYILQKYTLDQLLSGVYQKYHHTINDLLIKKTLLYLEDIKENVDFLGKPINKKTIKIFMKKLFKP